MSSEANIVVNLCKENGCDGACCKNIYFKYMSPDDAARITENAPDVRLSSKETIVGVAMSASEQGTSNHQEPEVFITPPGATRDVFISGACPNLQQDSSCGIYDYRPAHCRNFSLGSPACTEVRRTEGLPPIQGASLKPTRTEQTFFPVNHLMNRFNS